MGRPRKYPLAEPAVAGEPPEPDDDERDEESLEPEHLVGLALDSPRMRLTPEMVAALNQAWKDNVRADDDEGKAYARRIAARLKRASHAELHPGCKKITIDVPALKRQDNRGGIWYVKINERPYIGVCEVWECEARTILELVHRYRQIESERMSDDRQATIDLDRGIMIAERARAIQSA